MLRKRLVLSVFVCGMILSMAQAVFADSAYINLLVDGTSRDIGSGSISLEGGFSVSSGTAHYWASGNYYSVDLTSGTITSYGAPSSINSNGYGDPFGLYDSTTNTFYAATYANNGSSYLYDYDCGTGEWGSEYETVNIYGGAVYNGDVYISGLREPWTGGFDSTYISLVDLVTGISDALVETGGASAYLAFDNNGNVYYTPYTTSGSTALYRWTASQLASVTDDLSNGEEDTYLSLADGELLCDDLPGGGNGITVDDAGNVLITTNSGGTSYLLLFEAGSDDYEVIATNADGTFGWFGAMDIEGDFTQGASLYFSAGFGGCITEITMASTVPVPGSAILLATGLIGLFGIRRRR